MKKLIALLAVAACAAQAAVTPGPKGGKFLEQEPLHLEFFVNAEQKVEVTFCDHDAKPQPLAGQVVTAIAEKPEARTKLDFEAKDGSLVSTQPLPEGDGYRVVLQVKEKADAKPVNFRIEYHAEICGECNRAEYACTCDHAGEGEHEGHGH